MSRLSILPEACNLKIFQVEEICWTWPLLEIDFSSCSFPRAHGSLEEEQEAGPGQGGCPRGSVLNLCNSVLNSRQLLSIPVAVPPWMTSVPLALFLQVLNSISNLFCGHFPRRSCQHRRKGNVSKRGSLVPHQLSSTDSPGQRHHDFRSYPGTKPAYSFSKTNGQV